MYVIDIYKIILLSVFICSSCTTIKSDKNKNLQYELKAPDKTKYIPGAMTYAEFEHADYKKQYEQKLRELDEIHNEFLKRYKSAVKNSNTQIKLLNNLHEEFKIFIKDYAGKLASNYLRAYPYHYYGTMVDMIELRVKHIKLQFEDFW